MNLFVPSASVALATNGLIRTQFGCHVNLRFVVTDLTNKQFTGIYSMFYLVSSTRKEAHEE